MSHQLWKWIFHVYSRESIKMLNLFFIISRYRFHPICSIYLRLSIVFHRDTFHSARGRVLLKRIFPIQRRTNYVTRARESSDRMKRELCGVERVLESVRFIDVSCATPRNHNGKLVSSPRNRKKEARIISNEEARRWTEGHFGSGNLLFRSTKEFVSRIFSFPVIPHSANLSFAPSTFSKEVVALPLRRTLSLVSHHPDILHYTLARLIPRFIAAEDVPRRKYSGFGSNPRISIFSVGDDVEERERECVAQNVDSSVTLRRWPRVLYRPTVFAFIAWFTAARRSPPSRHRFRQSGRWFFRPANGFHYTPRVTLSRNVDASRGRDKCITPGTSGSCIGIN